MLPAVTSLSGARDQSHLASECQQREVIIIIRES